MNSKTRAEKLFRQKNREKEQLSEVEREARKRQEKTERLRALRLAKEEQDSKEDAG